jgi:hypothetical protein
VRERPATAGALLGTATLVHPNLGLLGAAVVAPAALLLPGGRRRNLLRLGVPLAVIALPALAVAVADQAGGSQLPADRRYELLVVVRQPHHMLFSSFPPAEYVRTALWLGAAVAGLAVLRRTLVARAAAVVGGLALALIGVGAYAALRLTTKGAQSKR